MDGPISSVRMLHHTPSKPPPPLTHSISHEIGIISTGSTGTGSYHMVVGSSLELGVVFLYVCHNKHNYYLLIHNVCFYQCIYNP